MAGVATAVALTIGLAGCGGEASGTAPVDHSKDENLMKAMGGYMEKRKAGRPGAKAKARAKADAAEASPRA